MKTVTIAELCNNIDELLEGVLTTGVPLEIRMGGRKLRIVPVGAVDKLQNLTRRPNVISGDPDDLVDIQWEVNLDLPRHACGRLVVCRFRRHHDRSRTINWSFHLP